jgi:hypothetical protein
MPRLVIVAPPPPVAIKTSYVTLPVGGHVGGMQIAWCVFMTHVNLYGTSGLSQLLADGFCLDCFNFIPPGIAIDGGDDGYNGYNGTMSKFQIALLKRKGRVAALEEEIEGQNKG